METYGPVLTNQRYQADALSVWHTRVVSLVRCVCARARECMIRNANKCQWILWALCLSRYVVGGIFKQSAPKTRPEPRTGCLQIKCYQWIRLAHFSCHASHLCWHRSTKNQFPTLRRQTHFQPSQGWYAQNNADVGSIRRVVTPASSLTHGSFGFSC